jgi:hypothetical protein
MSNMQTAHIELVTRTEHQRRTETVSFRCNPRQLELLQQLADRYKTTTTDVLIQLIELATTNK